jgi:hypothetical protein
MFSTARRGSHYGRSKSGQWPKSLMPVSRRGYPAVPYRSAPFARQAASADDVNPLLLTAQECAPHGRSATARCATKGLYTPPGLTETISMPGAGEGRIGEAEPSIPRKVCSI